MARTIPAGLLTALTQTVTRPYYAVEMLFDTTPVRFWTGVGDRTIQLQVYIGAGSLIQVSEMEEIADLSAKSASIVVSGLNNSIVSAALQEPYQRRICRILFGEVSSVDVIEMFSGKMNTMRIDDGPDTSTVTLAIESRLVELGRAKVRRYNHESHVSRYPGDNFFSYVADLQDKQVSWGRKQG